MRHIAIFDALEQFKDPNYKERTAFMKYKNGEVSIEYILTHNYKLCFDYINKHFINETSLTYEDKVSLATQGLFEAIRDYDIDKGCAFSTFAYRLIFNRFTKELRKLKRKKRQIKTISIDTQTNDDSDGDKRLSVLDVLRDDTNVSKQVENRVMFDKVKVFMSRLTQKERQVLEMRYFQGKSQLEVAAIRGVTQSNVSQIEKRALNYIRRRLIM